MSTVLEKYQDVSSVGISGDMSDRMRWEAFEYVHQAANIDEGIQTITHERSLSSSDDTDSQELRDNTLYRAWKELEKFGIHTLASSSFYQYFPESPDKHQSNDVYFDKMIQSVDEHLENGSYMSLQRRPAPTIRIAARRSVKHPGFEGEFQDQDDEWVDTAAVKPQKIASRRVRVRERRQLQPVTMPGEFEDDL
jgi:hypothetical protein